MIVSMDLEIFFCLMVLGLPRFIPITINITQRGMLYLKSYNYFRINN